MTDIHDDEPIDDPVYQRLLELEADDKLATEAVVAEAADPGSPLHTHFEWDDATAAHQHRLSQARQLIARYHKVKVDRSGAEVRYRAFTHVQSTGRYHDTDRALRDWRDEVMNQARRDLQTWELKYKRLGLAAQLGLVAEVLSPPAEDAA